jgi:amino acid adenylation domain-containing protein
MVSNREQQIAALPVLTGREREFQKMLRVPSAIQARSIHELFEHVADRTPDSIAVSAGESSLTYRQLDQKANRVARWLRRRGVGPNVRVALSVDRTIDLPIGFLGILKAGGAYVPLDPTYPRDRTDYMLVDAGVDLELNAIDDPDILSESPERLDSVIDPTDLAYIVYTSGSTGKPKGVMVTHASVVEYAQTLASELTIEPEDVYLHTASISFSSSVRQFFVPFAAGATVVIASTDERRDPIALLQRICDSQITVIDLVPTVVRQIVDSLAGLSTNERTGFTTHRVRLLLTASEPLHFGLVRDWRRLLGTRAKWINMYGQTETTGIVSLYRIPETIDDRHGIVPIGRPRPNLRLLVLDSHFRPVPCGVPGRLYIGSDALAEGYAADASLTAERFLPNPWDSEERLYDAGDFVRLAWDGTIEFLGRADQQVKIRGLRIEPAEIERVLLEHPGVREAVLSVFEDPADGNRLVAYVTSKSDPVSMSALRTHARQKLPEHMIPSAFVCLEQLPLTPNGKLDRGALPKPERVRNAEVEYVPPRTASERDLAMIWQQVLRVDRIGAGDNFFTLGGHSLLAAQVRSRVQNSLGVDIPLNAIFEDQTLSALALRIESSSSPVWKSQLPPLQRITRSELMPASLAQQTVWYFEQAEPGTRTQWIDLAIRIRGRLDVPRLSQSVQTAVERHEILRTMFRSSGGVLSQHILDSHFPSLRYVEQSDAASNNAQQTPFDLTDRPPIDAALIRTDANEHTLRLSVHRILCDGLSTRLFLSEIGALYANSFGSTLYPLLDTTIQYADYAAWERSCFTPERVSSQVEFFYRELKEADGTFLLPSDHPRPERRQRRGARLQFEFPADIRDAVNVMATQERASAYMVLLAAFASALARYARQTSVVIGSPVSRRTQSVTEQMIGPFMNTLPLKIDVPHRSTMPERIQHVKAVLLAALAHQDGPFHHVMAKLIAEYGPTAAGIGEVALVMEDGAPSEITLGDISLLRIDPDYVTARREITMSVAGDEDELKGTVVYDRDLFTVETIESIVRDFETALGAEEMALPARSASPIGRSNSANRQE